MKPPIPETFPETLPDRSGGDEAAAVAGSPGAAAFAQGDRIMLLGGGVGVDAHTGEGPLAEQAIHRGAAGFGQVQPQKGVANDQGCIASVLGKLMGVLIYFVSENY